jgi:hypothetical protein
VSDELRSLTVTNLSSVPFHVTTTEDTEGNRTITIQAELSALNGRSGGVKICVFSNTVESTDYAYLADGRYFANLPSGVCNVEIKDR